MGAWGTGVFENDTTLDTIAEMSELIDNFYKKLLENDNEHDIMLAGFLYLLATTDDEKIREDMYMQFCKADTDSTLEYEVDLTVKGLSLIPIKNYKYDLIGKLYKCLDEAKEWTDAADRKREVQAMIVYIVEGN